MKTATPISVNLVTTLKCNYNCVFCFSHLRDLNREPSTDKILEIPPLLKAASCQKLTLEGGEPFLCPNLNEILKVAKESVLVTCVVTNGSLITHETLSEMSGNLDWIGLSLDSSSEYIEKRQGRGTGGHVKQCMKVASWAHELGIRLKINTVVTSLNCREDMTELILKLEPERWKAFQMLQIDGENRLQTQELTITESAFQTFVNKHRRINKQGIKFVAERKEDMLGSYIMMLPDGRFFSNHGGRHVFGEHTIFEVGIVKALEEVGWDERKFFRRGGFYNWL